MNAHATQPLDLSRIRSPMERAEAERAMVIGFLIADALAAAARLASKTLGALGDLAARPGARVGLHWE